MSFRHPSDSNFAIDSPESSQVGGSTTSRLATTTASLTTSTTSAMPTSSFPSTSGGGGGNKKSSTNAGAIAGGVVGGVLGLSLIGLLGALLYRRGRSTNQRLAGPGPGASTSGLVPSFAGGAGAIGRTIAQPNMSQYNAVRSSSPPLETVPLPPSGGFNTYADTPRSSFDGARSVTPVRLYEYVQTFSIFSRASCGLYN